MTHKGFVRSHPYVARSSPGLTPNRDAVAMLLHAFGYPSTPPKPESSGKKHQLVDDSDE